MPFLAFGGTEKPRNYVSEYMNGESGTQKPFTFYNTYGENGKGEYTAMYDLVWDGEHQIYDPAKTQEGSQMMHMTMAPRSENMSGNSGAIIKKEGRVQCTPGYILVNGDCVLQPSTPICQPGWRKVDGVCVKAPREFSHGESRPTGSMGTAFAANEYPATKDNVLSLKRLRQYVQEKQSGDSSNPYLLSEGLAPLAIAFFFFVAIGVGCHIGKKG